MPVAWNQLPHEIWIEILQYLDYYDRQLMRCVHSYFKDALSQPKFMQKTKLVITPYNLNAILSWVKKTRLADITPFENVEIMITVHSKKLREVFKKIGRFAKTLKLHNVNMLNTVKLFIPNIQTLTFEYGEDELKLRPLDMQYFPNLKGLEFAGPVEYAAYVESYFFPQMFVKDSVKLERLQIIYMPSIQQEFFNILEYNAGTLKELDILFCHRPFEKADILSGIFKKFTKVEKIQLNGNCSSRWINSIFQSIPNESPLGSVLLMGLYDIDSSIIENIVHKWPNTLAQFQMMISPHLTRRSIRDIGILRDKLKKLDLTMCSIRSDALLKGIAMHDNYILQHLILDDNNALDELCIMTLSERLPNLLTLSLNGCRNGVNNNSLAAIFTNLIKLETLSIDECTRISDEGLKGLERLKNLRHLSIRCCRQISDRSLCTVFFFKHLHTLRMGYCQMITVCGIEEVVLNCPFIRELEIISCFMVDDESIDLIVSKLERLRVLNVSNCINLSIRAVNDIVDKARALRHLTMCGIDSFEKKDAERKFEALRPEVTTIFA